MICQSFLLHTRGMILHMASVFSERIIICFPSGCFHTKYLILNCKNVSCIYEIQCLPSRLSKDFFFFFLVLYLFKKNQNKQNLKYGIAKDKYKNSFYNDCDKCLTHAKYCKYRGIGKKK